MAAASVTKCAPQCGQSGAGDWAAVAADSVLPGGVERGDSSGVGPPSYCPDTETGGQGTEALDGVSKSQVQHGDGSNETSVNRDVKQFWMCPQTQTLS